MSNLRELKQAGVVAIAAALMLVSQPAKASTGLLMWCAGVQSCGMAGAGVSMPGDAVSPLRNPASIARAPRQASGAIAWFRMPMKSEALGPAANPVGRQKAGKRWFLGGAGGYVHRLSRKVVVGFAMGGAGGFGTKFSEPRSALGAADPEDKFDTENFYGLNLIPVTIAWTPRDDLAVGFSVIGGYSFFKANYLTARGTRTKGRLGTSRALGIGFRAGAIWDVHEKFSVGGAFSSPIWFDSFEKYNDLLRAPINTPAIGQFGFSWRIFSRTTLAADYKYLAYSHVTALGKAPEAGGFGWEDVHQGLIGIEHKVNASLTLRAGLNYSTEVIDRDKIFVNLGLPLTDTWVFAGGFSYRLNKHHELGVSFHSVPARTRRDPGSGDSFSQAGKDSNHFHKMIGGRFGYRYIF